MTRQKKILAVTIMLVAMFQMPQLALTSSINQLSTVVFPNLSLSAIQTAMSLTGLLAPIFSILTSFLIKQRIMSKRSVVTTGLIFLGAVGVFSIFCHSHFWQLCVMSILIGMATGSYLPTMTSIMIDNYPQSQVRSLTGYQTAFMNGGGILISLAGGFLVSLMWYGGYFIMLAGIPLALLAVLTIPPEKERQESTEAVTEKSKMNPRVFYYAASLFLFMMAYNAGGANLSVHLAAAGITATTVVGTATAIQMLGGSVAGILFGHLSKRLHDMMIPFAFSLIFIGFTMLNIFQNCLPVIFIAEFLIGASMSMIAPQCIVSISDIVTERNSATASAIVTCFAPNFGGFVSPIVFTNITMLLAGPSTNFRYQFVAFYALIVGAVFALLTINHKRRQKAALNT